MLTDTLTTDPHRSHFPEPFEHLVADHVLTPEQAAQVMSALDEHGRPAAAKPTATPWAARLAEIGAYLGAALVAAAGGVVVAQQWGDMSYAMRVGVLGVAATLLVLGGLSVVVARGTRAWDDLANGDTLRRLSGTLFTLGAGAAFATVMVALLSEQAHVTEVEAGRATLLAGATAFAILLVDRWQAPSALGELALFIAVVTMVTGTITMTATDDRASAVAAQWALLLVGCAWAAVGSFTGVLRNQTLAAALGLAVATFGAAMHTGVVWSDRFALMALVLATLTVYLTRPSWPWITAAIIAAVVLTVTWVGEAVGVALALLCAGVVVLVLAGGALHLHLNRDGGRS